MILDAIIKNIISPGLAFIIRIFPTITLESNLAPYVATAVGFFAELYSFISYFVPLDFFFMVVILKTGFYIAKLLIHLIKYVGEVL